MLKGFDSAGWPAKVGHLTNQWLLMNNDDIILIHLTTILNVLKSCYKM